MVVMGNIKTTLIHWWIQWFGLKDYDTKGYAIIPCAKCNQLFTSYPHYCSVDVFCELCYDSTCKECVDGSHKREQ